MNEPVVEKKGPQNDGDAKLIYQGFIRMMDFRSLPLLDDSEMTLEESNYRSDSMV